MLLYYLLFIRFIQRHIMHTEFHISDAGVPQKRKYTVSPNF